MKILLPLLTVLFVGLKLTGFIAWSWAAVLSPMWVPFLGGVICYLAIIFMTTN